MNSTARILTIAAALLVAASLSPRPAEAQGLACGDWSAQGFRDGSRGVPDSYLERKGACDGLPGQITGEMRRAAYASPDYDDYSAGYASGLALHCTAVNGYRVGRRNEAYQEVCPEDAEGGFLAAYRRGLADWAEENGHAGYWLDGAFVSLSGEAAGPPADPPPTPRLVAWSDRDAGEAAEDVAGFSEDRDWRELWNRTPVLEPEDRAAPPVVPPPAPPPAPRVDRYDDFDGDVYIFRDRDDRGFRRRPPRRKPRPEPRDPPAMRPDVRGE